SVTVADITGDGLPEILLGETGAASQLFVNAGLQGNTWTFKGGTDVGPSGASAVALSSLDGGHQAGLVLTQASGATQFLPGQQVPVTRIGLSQITVTLTVNGTQFSLGSGQGAFILTGNGVAGTFSGTV